MIKQAPYTLNIEDLSVNVDSHYIELLHFIPTETTFKKDVFPQTLIKCNYTDKEFQKRMDMRIYISVCSASATDQTLKFSGNFSVESNRNLTIPYVAIRLVKYCFDLMDEYINTKPIKDKEGKLFIMPQFLYGEESFKKVVADN